MIQADLTNDGLLHLQLADIKEKNALSGEMITEALEKLNRFASDPQVKVLMLSGLPDIFCSGASAGLLRELNDGNISVRDIDLAVCLISYPVPVIAAMEGAAIGGGLALALCSDITIASDSKRYGFNFTDLGFTPGMGTTSLLPALIGHHRAAEMMFTGKMYKGRELSESGLFNHVVPQTDVMERAHEIAGRLIDKPAHLLRLLKKELSSPRLEQLQQALKDEKRMHDICFSHDESRARLMANFTGRAEPEPNNP